MTAAEVSRALDEAYAHADKAFMAINGSALETHSGALADLAQKVRAIRDAIGTFDLPGALKKAGR
jgi:hypothetical protein